MSRSDSCLLISAELWRLIAKELEPNEVACTLRLLNRDLAGIFKDCTDVRLSQPVPHHAFVHRWGTERAMDHLARTKRLQLLILTARSGCLDNLKVAVSMASCQRTGDILKAAAAAGHLPICVWLHDSGTAEAHELVKAAAGAGHGEVVRWCLSVADVADPAVWNLAALAIDAAAGSGHFLLCEELLAAGFGDRFSAAEAAAKAGNGELAERLVSGVKGTIDEEEALLSEVAYGCPLPVLQQFFESRLANFSEEEVDEIRGDKSLMIQLRAVNSPTPDWRAKLDWLESEAGVGWFDENEDIELGSRVCIEFCKHPDVEDRIEAIKGNLGINQIVEAAARVGNVSVLEMASSCGWLESPDEGLLLAAAERGDVAMFKVLLDADWPIDSRVVPAAAEHGQLGFLKWMSSPEAEPEAREAFREARQEGLNLVRDAVLSGNLELVEWLRARGFPCEGSAFAAAVETGDVPLMERLASWGCPMGALGSEHELYAVAGKAGDFVVLRALRRLGCPWDPTGATFTHAVYRGCGLEVLKWMLAEGCSVDWKAAWDALKDCQAPSDVIDWVKSNAPSGVYE